MRLNNYRIIIILAFGFFTMDGISHEKIHYTHDKDPVIVEDTSFLQKLTDSARMLSISDPNKAVSLLDSVIKISKTRKEFKPLVVAYNQLGILYAYAGDFSKASNWILRGYNLAFENNDKIGTGRSLNNLSIVSRYQKQYKQSLEYIKSAIDIHLANNELRHAGISMINCGSVYKETNEYSKALEQYRLAIQYLDSADEINLKVQAKLYIAETYILSGKYNPAIRELKSTEQDCRQANDLGNLTLYNRLKGDYYFALNQFPQAREAYLEAFSVAQKQKNIKNRIDLLEKLAILSEKTEDFRIAYFYQGERHKLIDSANAVQNYSLMSRIELQDEFDEKLDEQIKQNEIKKQLQQSELNYQRRITAFLMIGLFILLALGIFAFLNYRQKLKSARLLASQRNEILLKNQALREQMEQDREKNEIIEFINQENQILSLVAKETDNSVFILNPDGKIEWVNEAFHRLSGYSLEEFIRLRGPRIQDVSLSENIHENFQKCVSTKKTVTYTSKTFTKDKQLVWIHTTLTPILDESNKVARLIAIDSDITKIKNAQDLIDQKNNEITSSLEYASKIQRALLPLTSEMDSIFKEYFVINHPQNIVSGDFFWTFKKNGQTLAIVADSTGHGVPGAFMSLLGISSLQEIVYKMQNLNPSLILEQLRERIIALLHYNHEGFTASESWDIAVCVIENQSNVLHYAGSNNSVLILRDDVLTELKPDKFFRWDDYTSQKTFTQQTLQLNRGDRIYLFTDGFSDQFGGVEGKKFSRRKLKKMLLDIYTLPMESQKDLLNMVLTEWKGQNEQVDDIMVMGFQV